MTNLNKEHKDAPSQEQEKFSPTSTTKIRSKILIASDAAKQNEEPDSTEKNKKCTLKKMDLNDKIFR